MRSSVESTVTMAEQTFLFGTGAAGPRLAAECAARGWRRAIVLVTGSLQGSPTEERLLREGLGGLEVHRVDRAPSPHALITATQEVADDLRNVTADVIVALGGGSASDTAKGIAVLRAEGGALEDHCSVFRAPDHFEPRPLFRPKLPIVAVPTTLSGAEVTPGAGATTPAGVKRTFWDPKVAARVVAFDPAVLGAVPPGVLLTTGMNGLAHCAEGLYSKTANPLSSALAEAGAVHLAAGLRAVAAGDLSDGTVAEISAGAACGGLVISNARVGLHHAVCHVLGARLGLAHGVANSIMLPHVLRFNRPETGAAQERLATSLAGVPGAADDAAGLVAALVDDIGVPHRLRDVGVAQDDLEAVARETMGDRGLYFNPRTVDSPDQVLGVLEAAW